MQTTEQKIEYLFAAATHLLLALRELQWGLVSATSQMANAEVMAEVKSCEDSINSAMEALAKIEKLNPLS